MFFKSALTWLKTAKRTHFRKGFRSAKHIPKCHPKFKACTKGIIAFLKVSAKSTHLPLLGECLVMLNMVLNSILKVQPFREIDLLQMLLVKLLIGELFFTERLTTLLWIKLAKWSFLFKPLIYYFRLLTLNLSQFNEINLAKKRD